MMTVLVTWPGVLLGIVSTLLVEGIAVVILCAKKLKKELDEDERK